MQIRTELPSKIRDNQFVAIDIEIFGAEKSRLHRPNTGTFASMSIASSDNVAYVITDEDDVAKALDIVSNGIWVFHNSSFDIMHLRRWADIKPKNMWDTLLVDKILFSGWYDSFSLQDVVRRHLGIHIEKDVRSTFEDATTLTREQIHYSGLDAIYTWQVAEAQKKILMGDRQSEFSVWKNIDMPAQWAFLDFMGWRLDTNKWEALAQHNIQMADKLESQFDFNPRSSQQVKKKLNSLGWKIPSTGEKILRSKLYKDPTSKAGKVCQALLDYRKFYTLHSRYGMKFLDEYVEFEECNGERIALIYPKLNVIGAETGRTSSNSPNIQNLPAREYPEFREPWIARPNHKLIVADYASQEPRVHAYLTQDKNLLDIFNSGEDIYVATAKYMYDKEIEKSDPLRNFMKVAFLGATYGQSAHGVAKNSGKSLEEAEDMQARFWKAFPGSKKWCDEQRKQVNYVETVAGRRIWLNPYSSQVERNALNGPHQGTAADMMKQATATSHQEWKWDIPFGVLSPIHDELVLDVPEQLAEEISKFISDVMVQTGQEMCPGIPFKVDAKICDNWREGK